MNQVRIMIIPVLDIMNGVVVHAIAGEREKYRPYTDSTLCNTPDPDCFLDKFREMGFRSIYIADLDSIIGRGSNQWVINHAIGMGFTVYADVGRAGISLQDSERLRHVIGTEYLLYPDELLLIKNRVASLDMEYNNVKFANSLVNIMKIAPALTSLTPNELLIINLKFVGTMKGINKHTIELVKQYYGGKLYVGGGLGSLDEIFDLKNYGIDGILVATLLHKGVVNRPYYIV
ncbi:HisA/HisF-related TIM barrel protein [Vulcanisaeta sp. JCM 14467]|uniref:HisA/HisF-related TIM barrel protein n=1 Tax=Vulcanisaeta sp. JCM 14467 TaxID=1295370 RepID=UPI000B2FEC0F|nr:HisA/HisF-related TIM barrel protein [Vulcanisaeta sp. JCM 14467]